MREDNAHRIRFFRVSSAFCALALSKNERKVIFDVCENCVMVGKTVGTSTLLLRQCERRICVFRVFHVS